MKIMMILNETKITSAFDCFSSNMADSVENFLYIDHVGATGKKYIEEEER